MQVIRNIIAVVFVVLSALPVVAQHPPTKKIDSLTRLLPATQGIRRISCLNALSEAYWWLPRVVPDSISRWADLAYQESLKFQDTPGQATAIMHLGVGEVCRKNLLASKIYLHKALGMFEGLHNDKGLGWCNLWLGKVLYSENEFDNSLEYFKRSLDYLHRLNDWEGEGVAWGWMGFLYAAMGEYDSSFKYCNKSLAIRQEMSDHLCVAAALTNMGHLFRVAGDNEDALDYFQQGLQYANTHSINVHKTNWNYLDEPMGIVYRLMNKPDSSLFYLKRALQIDPENQMTQVSLGETFLQKKQFDLALEIFLKPIEHFRRENDKWDLMRVLLDVGKAYEGKDENNIALHYALEGSAIAQSANEKQSMMAGYQLLSDIYKKLNRNDSAYIFLQKYTALKDSLMNKQFLWRLRNYKVQADYEQKLKRIALLDKDNKIKKEELANAAMIKWILAVGLLALVFVGFIVYRNLSLKKRNVLLRSKQLEQSLLMQQLEAETKQASLQQKTTELEMQLLRAQINPHFIFNSLNSINRFILQNEKRQASEYLTKFSRLVRMILQHSQNSLISLESELDALRLYIELEALRFNYHFSYKISLQEELDISMLKMPPLIIQPYVENAIWHGLMHKEEHGHLYIEVCQESNQLFLKISDDGVGRSTVPESRYQSSATHKSMGLQITAERIALLQHFHPSDSSVIINDLVQDDGKAAGTEVVIKLPFIYD
ncbi:MULTISPECIES: tetratricopeptide repeat-containing sensor histidine kinase [Niastella]|uniref:Tetratricopeptide repeat protein n=1 Tax=Niastella soli TaxID=2821487 RepID=A0ABS3Z105_9BACT|nr:tetratricopeptide repeat protein [Niastella soli]MBO9203838.1 tetratricopeptide repeat protein [Niastella soli]